MTTPFENIALLKSKDLSVGYRLKGGNKLAILSNLDLSIFSGELITFIGPNGCGKSTLIRSLIGLLPKLQGKVYFKNENLDSISFPERAQRIGVVLTDPVYERNMTVKELVTMGRYPHTNWLGQLSVEDKKMIAVSIEKVGLFHKKNARLGELSDGERQRAMIARVLSQDVELIILDEPTAHLDLSNRMEVLLLLKQLAHEFGKGILLSTHELSLAMQVSDRVWMVGNQQEFYNDIPEELIRTGLLDKTFGNDKISFQPWSASFELIAKDSRVIYAKGMGILQSCVVRLLKRLGFIVIFEDGNQEITIDVDEHKQEIIVTNGNVNVFHTLYELQSFLVPKLSG
jgi:iron complex transport system ATP-binding protein